MQATSFRSLTICCLFLCLVLIGACSGDQDDFSSQHLIRVGDRVVTVLDFNKAFELAETAHSFGLRDHPVQLREARERLLNQMTIEMLMLARADELNLDVTDEELDAAIVEIKADYPDETFEEALLEAAVPYDEWKRRLETRLLVEKLVAVELENQMTITPKDISAHYEKYFKSKTETGANEDGSRRSEADHRAIIKDLRRQKAEDAYDAWIEELKAAHPVELNASAWQKLLAPGAETDDENVPSEK
jgi:hypothetical protein